jgi:hypothetical protein
MLELEPPPPPEELESPLEKRLSGDGGRSMLEEHEKSSEMPNVTKTHM